MPESRDRLVRPVDYAAIFARRRAPSTGILIDDPEVGRNLFGSPAPVRQVATPATRGRFIGGGRGGFGTPRNARGRNLYGTPATGQENNPRTAQRSSGRGRTTGSVLPSWYPRTPLQDITAVVRARIVSLQSNAKSSPSKMDKAIERRRALLGDAEGLQIESPIPEGQRVLDPSETQSGAQLKHDVSMISPNLAVGVKPRTPAVGKVPKILLGITNQNAGESEFLTPQKKLLNSIDTVEKVVMEELQKLKRTPSAKKAEREKRIRTLMSMR